MKYLASIAALSLAACATTPAGYANVSGNAVSVIVSNVWNQADALPLAEAHCQKYGKSAQFRAIDNHHASFDCVSP